MLRQFIPFHEPALSSPLYCLPPVLAQYVTDLEKSEPLLHRPSFTDRPFCSINAELKVPNAQREPLTDTYSLAQENGTVIRILTHWLQKLERWVGTHIAFVSFTFTLLQHSFSIRIVLSHSRIVISWSHKLITFSNGDFSFPCSAFSFSYCYSRTVTSQSHTSSTEIR